MNSNLKKFFDALGGDKALRNKIEATKSAEEAYKIALGISGGYTLDEFKAAIESLKPVSKGDLPESELDKVTGGNAVTVTVTPVNSDPRRDPLRDPIKYNKTGNPYHGDYGIGIKIQW